MHARNRITIFRGLVEARPAAHLGALMRAVLDHFQQVYGLAASADDRVHEVM